MNITYIIGNGFDINLGLKTQYDSFYKWYVANPSDNESSVVVKFKKEITSYLKNKNGNWSDLEWALGRFSSVIPPNLFPILYMDIAAKLKQYLCEEYKSFDPSSYDGEKLRTQLADPISGHFNEARTKILNSFSVDCSLLGDDVINIISFNYTNTLEDILKFSGEERWKKATGGYVTLKSIAHVHHTLQDNNIVFGVNDISQVANHAYKHDKTICDLFVKPQANDVLGGYVHTAIPYIIQETNLFVFFGVSGGATDCLWWNLVGKRLVSSPKSSRIIWFVHDTKVNPDFKDILYRDVERRIVTDFKAKTRLPRDQFATMDGRIFVTLSDRMFSNLKR